MRRVAVTGLGIVSPLGNNQRDVVDSLRSGRSGVRFREAYRDQGLRSHVAGVVDIDPADFLKVKEAIEAVGIAIANADIDNIPDSRVTVSDTAAQTMFKLFGVLEDLDDVQNVYANYDVSEQALERYGG